MNDEDEKKPHDANPEPEAMGDGSDSPETQPQIPAEGDRPVAEAPDEGADGADGGAEAGPVEADEADDTCPPAEPAEEDRTVFAPAPPPSPRADPPEENDRTIFAPPTFADSPPSEPEQPPEDARTVFAPPPPAAPPATTQPPGQQGWGAPPPPPPATAFPQPGTAFPPPGTAAPYSTQFAPREPGRSIQVGDVLNHIFEVRRFIARGGMGEVFEGVNVNSEERVAIKVMLPQLAADPNVVAMFRKEARTLTRMGHEALVQYRVLAQEPQLGVLYIVTEYIDGTNLADVLGQVPTDGPTLRALLRRLASGLRAAHALGAIHRDISPDNVLLEGGRLEGAKIIDFGIAKDLDPGSATIVGEGFAGKLSYVAPEQLGDFGREVGPWTDVYSLGLVLLAVAEGRNVNMGGSLVDAVDKRRAGPDLSPLPDDIRDVVAAMLVADPAQRLRSMDAVLDMLSGGGGHAQGAGMPPPPPTAPPTRRGLPLPLIGGAVIGLVLLAVLGWFLLGRAGDTPAAPGQASQAGPGAVAAAGDPVEAARRLVDTTLPSVGCTWLSVVEVKGGEGGPTVQLTGVAGNPAQAQGDLARSLETGGVKGASLDFADVATITPAGCAVLDTYRQVRDANAQRLSVPQRRFELRMQEDGKVYAGKMASNAVVEMNIDGADNMVLIGLEPSGILTPLFDTRAAFEAMAAQSKATGYPIADEGGGRYRLNIDADHEGWSGVLLVTGKGAVDAALVAPGVGNRGPEWQSKFLSAAAEKDWKTNMVWFKSGA